MESKLTDKNYQKVLKPLYIFLHIPKTGGTTIRGNVETNFDKKQYSMLKTGRSLFSQSQVFTYYKSLSQSEKDDIVFIGGHFAYYGVHNFFPGRDCRYITFLREPIYRLISHYNHCLYLYFQGKRSPWTENFFKEKSRSFSSWLSHNQNEKSCFAFLASRLLNKKMGAKLYSEDLEKIKRVLKKFYFIGISNNNKDFELVYKLIGIRKNIPNQNLSKDFINYRDEGYLIPEKDYGKIKVEVSKWYEQDIKLYDFCLGLNNNFKQK